MSFIFGDGGASEAADAQIKAAELAADAMGESTDKIIAFTKEMQEPWRNAGVEALGRMEEGIASGAYDYGSFDADSVFEFMDPSYEFRKQEGLNAIESSASAGGRVQSGATQKAMVRYAGDTASQEYGNAYQRALSAYQARRQSAMDKYNVDANIAGTGQVATNTMTGTVNNALQTQGQAVAGKYNAIGAATANEATAKAENTANWVNNLITVGALL